MKRLWTHSASCRTAPIPRLAALFLAWALAACTATPEPAPDRTDAAPRLRVMTWNIHHGRGLDGAVDLQRIAAVIRASGAQLVALQEVDVGTKRTGGRNLAAELAELCGMRWVFHKNIDFQGGEYGNAVLTSLPILDHDNRHYKMVRPHEQRGLLRVALRFGGRTVQFFATHIDYRKDDVERVSNLAEIRELLEQDRSGAPWIVCGDFNDVPDSRTWRAADAMFADAWAQVGAGPGLTYPSDAPTKRIDYVFVRRGTAPGFVPERATIPASLASDHLPLVVDLRLR